MIEMPNLPEPDFKHEVYHRKGDYDVDVWDADSMESYAKEYAALMLEEAARRGTIAFGAEKSFDQGVLFGNKWAIDAIRAMVRETTSAKPE